MDIPLAQFLTNHPAILSVTILAAIMVGLGLIFEVMWHFCKRKNISGHTHSSDDNNINNDNNNNNNSDINKQEGRDNLAFYESDSKVTYGIERRLETKMDALKCEMQSMKDNIVQVNSMLKTLTENVRS